MGTLTLITRSGGTLTTNIKHGTPLTAGLVIGIFPLIYTYAGDVSSGTSTLTPAPTSKAGGVITTINKH